VDVTGAKAAGWTPVWLDRKGMPGAIGQDPGVIIAASLLELPKLLA
jgi:FMN phosphatase YigB (HAD superfamily)